MSQKLKEEIETMGLTMALLESDLLAAQQKISELEGIIDKQDNVFMRNMQLASELEKALAELTKEREAKTKAINSLSYIANKPIAVFGEGFGYKEHYEWLKEDARRSLASLKEGNEPNEG